MTARKQKPQEDEVDNELQELLEQAQADGEDIGDDEVEIDLSEAATFEAFTAPKVPVEITAAALKHGKDSKKPYIEFKMRVIEGEYEGRILWTNVNLTGKGAGFGFDKLTVLGAKSKDGQLITKENRRVSLAGLKGLRASVDVAPDKREEYKHKVVVGKFHPYVSPDAAAAGDIK
jgi:hypothetical protein